MCMGADVAGPGRHPIGSTLVSQPNALARTQFREMQFTSGTAATGLSSGLRNRAACEDELAMAPIASTRSHSFDQADDSKQPATCVDNIWGFDSCGWAWARLLSQ